MHFDVFNGDADGVLALLQLRLAEPKESTLITGVKRDIALLKQVNHSQATSVTVLDISMEKNAEALNALLTAEVPVTYIDHHRAGAIPKSSKLDALIDTDPNTCTSLLVNQRLNNAYVNWAITAAYGDNMTASAEALADSTGLSLEGRAALKALGIYINYNGYGRTVGDLHFDPKVLFRKLLAYPDPLTLVAEQGSIFSQLELAYLADMMKAQNATVLFEDKKAKVLLLEDAPWAHRISGVYGNLLANETPDIAHAVLTPNAVDISAGEEITYTVSVRAPLNNKTGADEVCIQFVTGGGRKAAAGINQLPQSQLSRFYSVLSQYYC